MASPITIRPAATAEDLEITRVLLREYAAYLNESLGEEHICLSNYERELAALPGSYAEPRGAILLACVKSLEGEEPAGCIALKPLKPDRAILANEAACEMKRLWVRTAYRGQSIGLALTQALIAQAREKGYAAMYLDTVPGAMKSANAIYQKLSFEPVERYNTNPILGAHPSVAVEFFRLSLRTSGSV